MTEICLFLILTILGYGYIQKVHSHHKSNLLVVNLDAFGRGLKAPGRFGAASSGGAKYYEIILFSQVQVTGSL